MSDNKSAQMCIDCVHAVWPHDSQGECHAPTQPADTLTITARSAAGACGPGALLFARDNTRHCLDA